MKSKLLPYASLIGIYKHFQRAINLLLEYMFKAGMMNSLLKAPCFHPVKEVISWGFDI